MATCPSTFWVTGPEGQEDSGQGRIFFTQTSIFSDACVSGPRGTAVNGGDYFWTGWTWAGGAPSTISGVATIKAGDTTKDRQFTLETVACLGCCAIGPVVVIDEAYHGHATIRKVGSILKKYQKGKES